MRVLLTSPRAPVTLDLARRFHNRGDEVYLCDSLRFGCANFSRAKKRSLVMPSPRASISNYIDSINGIIQKEKIELLVPTCEEIFYLAACKNKIDCEVFVDSFQTLDQIHNKWSFSQTAANPAGRVPESFQIQSKSQLTEFRNRCRDFVFKPVYSRFASETLIQPEAKQLDCISVSERKPWIAQRFVRGKEFSTYSVARQGRLLAHCTYRSLFRAGIGSGICFQAEPNRTITEFTENFVKHFKFTGQIGFDCIVNHDQEVWVLEGNPRSTSGLHLFDDNSLLVDAIIGKENSLIEPIGGPSQMIGAAMLVYGLKDAIARRNLKRYVREMFTSKDVLFRWSDPLPALGLPLTLGELLWVALRERLSLQQASTFDIEWNGEMSTVNTLMTTNE